jgi:hypothetical protein
MRLCQRRAALEQQWQILEQACQQQDDARSRLAASWQQVRADLVLAVSLFLLVFVLLGSGLLVLR